MYSTETCRKPVAGYLDLKQEYKGEMNFHNSPQTTDQTDSKFQGQVNDLTH